jgi:hypothetical protein
MLICPLFVLSVLTALFALFALAWRFEPTMVVVLFGVLRFVLAMVGAVARIVIQNLNILSSQDTNNTKSNTKHKNLNVSYTVYGTNSGGLSGSIFD